MQLRPKTPNHRSPRPRRQQKTQRRRPQQRQPSQPVQLTALKSLKDQIKSRLTTHSNRAMVPSKKEFSL